MTMPYEPFKTSIHMVHGFDVARAIMAVRDQFNLAVGSRWIVTDGRVYVSCIDMFFLNFFFIRYDWWDLASAWGAGGEANRDKVPSGLQPTVTISPLCGLLQ